MSRCMLALICGLLALSGSARQYTEGWLNAHYNPVDTNAFRKVAQTGFKTQSIWTNNLLRAPKRLLATAPQSSIGLDVSLPVCSSDRIRELARGLDHDWQKCFDFVRNNISYAIYPGIMRGPERTLIDREGNDADQSFLLVALLRESGYTASVIYEPLVVDSSCGCITSGFLIPFERTGVGPGYNACDWTGINTAFIGKIVDRFLSAGVDCDVNGGGDIVLSHYWVVLTMGNEKRYLDPSFKPHDVTAAHNCLTDMGYSRNEIIAACGGAVSEGLSVRNLSRSGLEEKLKSYVSNLRASWDKANASAEDFLGKKIIVRREESEGFFNGSYFSDVQIDLSMKSSEYRNSLRTKAVLTCDGNSLYSFYLDEVGLRNLWLTSVNNSPSSSTTKLYLDGICIKTLNTSSGSSAAEVIVDIQHLFPTTHPYYLSRGTDKVYSLVVGFDGDAKNGIRKYASEELARLRSTGRVDTEPHIMAASLYLQGQQWLSQCAMSRRLMNQVVDGSEGSYYNIGIAGQSDAPYVDMANRFSHSGSNGALFRPDSFFSSALEHSVVEQLNDIAAVSTVKILNLANQNGDNIYFVTSQNVDTVVANISNYASAFKNTLISEAKAGATYLLPQNGQTVLNQWKGTGYVRHMAEGGVIRTTMAISGGMNGGYGSEFSRAESDRYMNGYVPGTSPRQNEPDNFCADPVSLPSGAYHDLKTDLVLTRLASLEWVREYDSRNALSNSGLGRGWSHNFDSRVIQSTDAESVFGLSTPDRVLASVVAMAIANDMLSDQRLLVPEENARRWMIAAIVTQWWTENLNNTSISIKTGAKTSNFLKLPDGTYSPDPGDTSTLTEQYGLYTLQERHGNKYTFNWKNLLSEIEDRSGNKITLSYTYDQHANAYLVAVANNFDARIDITWNGASISKVTDSAGRTVEYTYDGNGCLTSVKDVLGKNWAMTYDPLLYALVSKTDPIGQRLIYNNYNQFGQVTNQISDVGGVWSFGYLGSVSAWNEDPHGNKMQQWYDDSCHALMTRNRDGTVTECEYDGHGHIVTSYDELGHVTTSAYDGRDNMVRLDCGTGSLLQTTTFAYDESDRLVATTDALGNVTRFSYDSCDRLVESVAADGSRVANTWNANGTVAEIRKYDIGNQCVSRVAATYGAYGLPMSTTSFGVGLPSDGIASSVTYNALGLPVTKTDANGNVTQISYDLDGKVLSATDANGATATQTYADNGQLASQTDALGRTTSFVRSASGKVLETHFADGTSSLNRYDSLDQLVESRDVRGGYALMTYDPRGRMISTTGPAGTSYVVYDAVGNVTATTNAAGEVVRSSYDELNRCVSTVDGLGSTWLTEYDKLNRTVATVNPLGKIKRQAYDVLSRLSVSTSSLGAQDRFGYDPFGSLSIYTNAENNVYRRFYDAAGHVLAVTNALGVGVSQLTYDGNGNLIRSVDGENHIITYGYNKVNRLISVTGEDFAITKQYDAVGNVVRATNDEADETFSYDKNNALVAATVKVGAKTYSLAWSRDAGGLVTNITYESGKSVSRTHDLSGRLTRVTDWQGHAWTFLYDALGRLTRLTYPTGVEKVCTYDAVGRLASWRVGTIQGRTMTYDAAGRRTSDRIDYGPVPNLTSQKLTGAYNAADQLVGETKTKSGTSSYEQFAHDCNGAMTNIVSAGVTTRSFAYNSRGQFAGLTEDGQTVTCAYDAMGNRIRIGDSVLIPNFTDSLSRPLCAMSASATKYYIWANNELLGVIAADGSFVVTYCDSFSSVIAHSDASGNLLSNVVYGPHGEIWSQAGTPLIFRWLGGYGVRQQADGLYLTFHRLYDGTRQRFLSSDPMGLGGGLNLYAYGNGNPLMYVDPFGLCAEKKPYWGKWSSGISDTSGPFAGNIHSASFGGGVIVGGNVNIGENPNHDVVVGVGGNVAVALPAGATASTGYIEDGWYAKADFGLGVQGELGVDQTSPSANLNYSITSVASVETGYNVNLTHPTRQSAQVIGQTVGEHCGGPIGGVIGRSMGGVIYDKGIPYYEQHVSPWLHW